MPVALAVSVTPITSACGLPTRCLGIGPVKERLDGVVDVGVSHGDLTELEGWVRLWVLLVGLDRIVAIALDASAKSCGYFLCEVLEGNEFHLSDLPGSFIETSMFVLEFPGWPVLVHVMYCATKRFKMVLAILDRSCGRP